MSRALVFRREVAGDLAAAIIWYRNNRPGLDADFQREFKRNIGCHRAQSAPVSNRRTRDAQSDAAWVSLCCHVHGLGTADFDNWLSPHSAKSGSVEKTARMMLVREDLSART